MKDNRGFTLVELLAVIVLIAVLGVVAVSTYRGINESSKNKTLEAKVTQLKSAAEKWARENNITSRTQISVNALVVEGYVTADEVNPNGLAMIKNPVTSENMICNTIDITFENGVIKTNYHSDVQNCDLANQSLIDNKINIRVVDSDNNNITGAGSIAKWTNKDVVIIVNSSDYDNKATSISYDFEGNTIIKNKSGLEKYSGTSFISKNAADGYYNTFYIESELILNSKVVVTYEIPGEGTKSRAYTIRFDKEEATAVLKTNGDWITEDTPITIFLDDGKGSGPKNFYLLTQSTWDSSKAKVYPADYKGTTTEDLKVGKYYVWTEDNAGNISGTYKMLLEVNNIDKTEPDCEVVFHGNKGKGHWYKEVPVKPGAKNITPAGVSGINLGVNTKQNEPVYNAYASYNTINEAEGELRTTDTPLNGIPYYCHAKTLAGKYTNATQTLWLDMTPPTITIAQTTDPGYTQSKSINVQVVDNLSGIDDTTTILYGWAHPGQEPSSWQEATYMKIGERETGAGLDLNGGGNLTGVYYLWVDVSRVHDYAGNTATSVNGKGVVASFGPYMFDNTPPVCNGNNGKTTWTNGSYTIEQYCRDDYGTVDQSGCLLNPFFKQYLNTDNVRSSNMRITDKAGNETICNHDVYLEHIRPSCSLTEPGADGDNGWYKSNSVTISASFQDNGNAQLQSGVGQKGTAKTQKSTNGSSSVTFTENGTALTAYCYVKDVAGNEGSDSLIFKKDDASNALNGGCSKFLGNNTWANLSPVRIGVSVNNKPISGCSTWLGDDLNNGDWDANCNYYFDKHVQSGNFQQTYDGANIGFRTNSGVNIVCPGMTHNIYSDRTIPGITVTRSNTGTTSGVTFTVTCTDTGSGCVTSGDDQGTHTGVTSSKTYTVKDKAGNEKSKTETVTAQRQKRTRSCTQGKRCADAGCSTANTCTKSCCGTETVMKSYYLNHTTCTADGLTWITCGSNCPSGCLYSTACCVDYVEQNKTCTSESCCGCDTYKRSISKCGCNSWGDWGAWTNVTSCTAGESSDNSTDTECRTLYS